MADETRIERLDFHLKTGDYFRVLATVLGFLEETVVDCSCNAVSELAPFETEAIQTLRKDLAYLHDNYRIVPITSE